METDEFAGFEHSLALVSNVVVESAVDTADYKQLVVHVALQQKLVDLVGLRRREYAELAEHTGHNFVVDFEDGHLRIELFEAGDFEDSVVRKLAESLAQCVEYEFVDTAVEFDTVVL